MARVCARLLDVDPAESKFQGLFSAQNFFIFRRAELRARVFAPKAVDTLGKLASWFESRIAKPCA